MFCIFLLKILQDTELKNLNSGTSIISAPPSLGELPGQREIHAITMNRTIKITK